MLKSAAGRPPHLRALIGAMLLKATRDMTWRQAEDQIRPYAPARYLCGLTETDWSPDHTTLHDFAQLLGEQGVALLSELTVRWAIQEKLASSRYNFNRPRARSVEMMGTCGQLAVLGFNLNKLLRGLAEKRQLALAG